jgi:hypothetical protein
VTSLFRRNRWVARGLLALVAVLVLVAFARVEHTSPLLLPMVLVVATVVAIGGLLLDTADFEVPSWEVPLELPSTSSGQDMGLVGNVRLIENHLSARHVDPLLPGRLARLADDRLGRLGLRRDDPGVRDRLGPTLNAVLDGPARTLRRTEIEECIRRIEELT